MLAVVGLLAPVPSPTSSAVAASVDLVGEAGAARKIANPWISLPPLVQPGDRLVLILSLSSDAVTVSSPTGVIGWTLEGTRVSRSMKTVVWSRIATAGDAGARVDIALSGAPKSTIQVAAYRGVDPGPLAVFSRAETNTSAVRTTPLATASENARVVSYWASKSASVSSWTAPPSVTVRRTVSNTGSGRISSLLADSGTGVPAGDYGGLEATTNETSTAATTWTVVLPVATVGGAQPVADFVETCASLHCSFDATSSSGPEGPIAAYDWDFGDGETGTGQVVEHTYAKAGSYQVDLVVTDGEGATSSLTRTVTVAVPRPEIVPVEPQDETAPTNHSGDAADDPAIWVHPTSPAESLVIGNDKKGALEVYALDGTRLQRITTSTSFWGNVDVRQGVTINGQVRDVVVGYNAGLRTFDVDPDTRRLNPVGDGSGTVDTGGGEGLCAYHSAVTGDLSVFVITRAGRVRQYLIDDADGDGLLEGTLQREFQVGSEAEGCVADDHHGQVYVAQESVGLWRYGAEPGDGSGRTLLDRVRPDGNLSRDVEGVTLVDTGEGSGYIIASAQNINQPTLAYFNIYERQTNAYVSSFDIADGSLADGCERTDGITAYAGELGPSFPEGLFVCQDDGNSEPATGHQNFKLTRLDQILPGN
jgi:3-phytase